MQQIYNVCPILDHPDFQKILDKFQMIGPPNIDEILKNSKIQISFDENKIKIDSISNYKNGYNYIGMIDK